MPGIDFSNDPLLQGRLFSYLDTQLIRLGGANFHEIPINRAQCPMRNFQRDGVRRIDVPKGQVAYEPNSLAPDSPRENPARGFTTFPAGEAGDREAGNKIRERSDTFADHYSQPRLFWRSMSEPEQRHIVNAFTFELGKVATVAIRRRMLGHLANIDRELCKRVEEGLGMEGQAEKIQPARPPIDMKPSPALSIILKAPKTIEGRKVGVLVSDGTDAALVDALRSAVEKAGARLQVVAPKIGGAKGKGGKLIDCGSHGRGRSVHLLRRRRRGTLGRGSRDAGERSRRHRLAARCVRPSESHRRRHRGRAARRARRDRKGCRSRRHRQRERCRRDSSLQRRTGASGTASRRSGAQT